MTMSTLLMLVTAAAMVGILVGCVGVGGVLLAPALAYVGGLELHAAMATGMWSFLFTGVVGTATYVRRGSVDWQMARWLGVAVVPAALLGARGNAMLSVGALTALLAALLVVTGLHALSRPSRRERPAPVPGVAALLLIGVLVGFGSALTGTGGPALLVPILVLLGIPTLAAVSASQVVQVPVAAAATLGYALSGGIDVGLGTVLGSSAAGGVVVGARIAHATPARILRRVVGSALVGAGCLMLLRVLTADV